MTDMTPDSFRKACGYWASGVSIVTTADTDGKLYGLTMNAVTSLSLTPPLFLICVDNKSDSLEPLRRSGVFCINVLSEAQQALSNSFAKKNPHKFEGVAHTLGSTGAPLLDGHLLAIECTVAASYPGGDHQIFVGDIRAISIPREEGIGPVIYYRGRYAALTA